MRKDPRRHAGRVAQTIGCAALLAAVWSASAAGQAPTADATIPQDFVELVGPLQPAVVSIAVELAEPPQERVLPPRPAPDSPLEEFFRRFFDPAEVLPEREAVPAGLASGFIIDPEGYIVTKDHVVRRGLSFTFRFDDGTELDAELIGRDDLTELALLKVDAPGPLPAVTWGDSEATQVGEWAVVISSPFGLGNTVTVGVISAPAREIGAELPVELLPTDAALNVGSSGGPMFNRDGEVISVSVAILSPTGGNIGVGFAVPSSVAQPVIRELRRAGEIRWGWLGVSVQEVTDEIAGHLGLDEAKGVLVAEIEDDSPGGRAGLQIGDVILSFGDRPVEDARDLQLAVAGTEPGTTTTVELWRDDQRWQAEVQVGRRPAAEEARHEARPVEPEVPHPGAGGLTLAPLTPDMRQMLGIDPAVSGVLVAGVDPDRQAGRSGLRRDDVIQQVDGEDVAHPGEVERKLERAVARGDDGVLLLVRRGGSNRFVVLSLERQ